MSYTNKELDVIVNAQADFDLFLSEKKWTDAEFVMDNLGELGYEHEALLMHHAYNRVRHIPEKGWASMTENERNKWADKENMREDLLVEPEDPRDVADRNGY